MVYSAEEIPKKGEIETEKETKKEDNNNTIVENQQEVIYVPESEENRNPIQKTDITITNDKEIKKYNYVIQIPGYYILASHKKLLSKKISSNYFRKPIELYQSPFGTMYLGTNHRELDTTLKKQN